MITNTDRTHCNFCPEVTQPLTATLSFFPLEYLHWMASALHNHRRNPFGWDGFRLLGLWNKLTQGYLGEATSGNHVCKMCELVWRYQGRSTQWITDQGNISRYKFKGFNQKLLFGIILFKVHILVEWFKSSLQQFLFLLGVLINTHSTAILHAWVTHSAKQWT